uniref:NADH-ubiquinone oxidoreductase chain 4 n=1 Tax=Acmaeodera sp. NCS-2009 TaxID=590154 RepID=D1G5N0_9COLE|nr:NADH dehydrogenase subunit 4 [Acmaeodera sp. NCS-2009]ACM45045.1 NADH dehydrogenase subunit 4 [Acmaeodera sp. NCS-2009]
MVKYIIMMIFMMPLCFKKDMFWINQFYYFILAFFFVLGFSGSFFFASVGYIWGCDLLGRVMCLLTLWICALMILSSGKIYKNFFFSNAFLFMNLFLVFSLFCAFCTLDLFIFYLFFEVSLIPTLILILGWGYQPERIQAGNYLFFYTLFASLPMMVGIFFLGSIFGSLDFFFLRGDINNLFLYFCMSFVFLIKTPMYLVHLWLPKAHVEAPVAGSMILAGIMLKLGGYGLLRVLSMFSTVGILVNFILISISLVGGVSVSLICLRQTDIKSLIAYSSVAHMGLALSGILTFNCWGFCGAFCMMVAHALCSSGLFCLANINYERLHSRSLFLNKGLLSVAPNLSLWWFLLCSSNMAAPPSLNLLGEIMLINSLVSWCYWTMISIAMLSFFSACYSLYLYSYTQHGKFYLGLYSFLPIQLREYLLLFLHWVPLNLLVLKGEYFSIIV